jgi:hypothetical protein
VADWLQNKLMAAIEKYWKASQPEQSMTDAFLAADRVILAPKSGFMGMGERGG